MLRMYCNCNTLASRTPPVEDFPPFLEVVSFPFFSEFQAFIVWHDARDRRALSQCIPLLARVCCERGHCVQAFPQSFIPGGEVEPVRQSAHLLPSVESGLGFDQQVCVCTHAFDNIVMPSKASAVVILLIHVEVCPPFFRRSQNFCFMALFLIMVA